MKQVLHQKGANGLVAEYECAVALQTALSEAGYRVTAQPRDLSRARDDAIERVANELSAAQVARGKRQGRALAEHIATGIWDDPIRLGLNDTSPAELRTAGIELTLVGNQTNSGSSADIKLDFFWPQMKKSVPISLKAYGRRPASLGSKGMKPSLTRTFMGEAKASDKDFVDFFGDPARQFLDTLLDFRAAANEFYASKAGADFVIAYRSRKGLGPTAKVNNPLRRKEVGDYFAETRGFYSEHHFAHLYGLMWASGMHKLQDEGGKAWGQFLTGFRFLIGMDDDILTLNAIADDFSGAVIGVENSFLSGTYADIRKALVPECNVELHGRSKSSTMHVTIKAGDLAVDALTLAVWKDATIQFKLNSETPR